MPPNIAASCGAFVEDAQIGLVVRTASMGRLFEPEISRHVFRVVHEGFFYTCVLGVLPRFPTRSRTPSPICSLTTFREKKSFFLSTIPPADGRRAQPHPAR